MYTLLEELSFLINFITIRSDNNIYSIVFVTHYTELYGANRSMLNLISGLKKNSVNDISVIMPTNGAVCAELKKSAVKFYIIPFVNEIHDYRKQQFYFKMLAKKYYNLFLIARHKYHFKKSTNLIIHTNSSVTFFGAYLAKRLAVPHVWHIREFGKSDYKLISNFGNEYFFKWLNKASAVICISKALFNHRLNEHVKTLTSIVYNGVIAAASINNNISLFPKNKIFRFGISGHISPEKNQEEAIKAFKIIKKNNDCELLIAGTGNDIFIKKLELLVKENELEGQVKFVGFINNISKFYESLDCMIVCAKNEALGRVTIEAMSNGLPVIGFNSAGTAEIIQHGYNGLLYDGDYTKLAEKMDIVMDDYASFFDMRLHAIQTVKDKFTIEICADAVMNIYKKIYTKAS